MKPMAPMASSVKSASIVYQFVSSAQSSVDTAVDARINTPPMVGVPAFSRWVAGPSLRTTWPTRSRVSARMVMGPSTNASTKDVTRAPAALNVMKRKRLKTMWTSARPGSR